MKDHSPRDTQIPSLSEVPSDSHGMGTDCSYDTSIQNDDSTESGSGEQELKKVVCRFDRYDITVLLTADDRFYGIFSVKETRDFLSREQFLDNTSSIDTDIFYTDADKDK